MTVDEEPREGMLSSFYKFAKADKTLIKVDKVDEAVVVVERNRKHVLRVSFEL